MLPAFDHVDWVHLPVTVAAVRQVRGNIMEVARDHRPETSPGGAGSGFSAEGEAHAEREQRKRQYFPDYDRHSLPFFLSFEKILS